MQSGGADYKNVRLLSVYDGDTFTVDLPCDESLLCDKIAVRIKGIDTPEIRGKCLAEREKAIQARDYLRTFLQGGRIDLIDCKRGKYFRIVCEIRADGQDVSTHLIGAGLGRYYDGKSKRESWCP